LRGGEAVLFVFFATTGKSCEKEADSQEYESCGTICPESKETRFWPK
jgi:hypothetical protein